MERPIPIDLQIALAHAERGNYLNLIDYYSRIGRKDDAGVFLRRNGRHSSAARMFHEAAADAEVKAAAQVERGRKAEAERLRTRARRLKLKAISQVFRVAELGDIRDARFFWERVGEKELIGRLAERVLKAVKDKFARNRLNLDEVSDAIYLLKIDGRPALLGEMRRVRQSLMQSQKSQKSPRVRRSRK